MTHDYEQEGSDPAETGHVTTLYYDASNRARTAGHYVDKLRGAGWKEVDLGARFPQLPRGAFASGGSPKRATWCSPHRPLVALTIETPREDTSALNVVVSTGTTITAFACGERAPTEGVETFDSSFIVDREFVHAPLPEFAETPGVSLAAAGPAIGRSTSEARVTSSLGLTAVFESFASQLRRAGWSPKASASTAGLRSQTFTKTVEGKPCIAVLTINALDATHYMALADVTRIKN